MYFTRALASAHQPLIRFVGKRTTQIVDAAPVAHPASPTGSLPANWTSFASYRQSAQQHGPLGNFGKGSTIGSASGASLGPVAAGTGVAFDRNELPARFQRTPFSMAEIEAVMSGGATLC